MGEGADHDRRCRGAVASASRLPTLPGRTGKGDGAQLVAARRRAHAPGPRPGRHRPAAHRAQPVGRRASSCATARSSARARPNRPAAPTPRSRRCAPPATAPAAPPSTPPSSRARTTGAPRRAPIALAEAGVARVVVALPRSRPPGRRAGRRPAPRPRPHRRRRRRRRRRAPAPSPPTCSTAASAAPSRVVKTAMSLDGRIAAARRLVAVDHRRRRRAPTPTRCAPTRRPSSSAPAPRSADRPRLTARDVDPPGGPPAAAGAPRRHRPGPRRRPAVRRRARRPPSWSPPRPPPTARNRRGWPRGPRC